MINYLYLFFFFIFIILINLILINFAKKYQLFIDNPYLKKHSVHSANTPRVLGISYLFLFPIILYFKTFDLSYLFFISLILMSIGIIEDLKFSIKPKIRLILQFVIIFLFLNLNNIFVLKEISFLNLSSDSFLLHKIITSVFIVALINSINFIDGLNGLCLSYTVIIFLYLYFLTSDKFILIFILFNLVILFFNFPNPKSFIGDSGSYFLGTFIGLFLIYYFNLNYLPKSEWFIANLLAYPIADTTTCVLRRLIRGKSPFYPDNLHFHSLLNRLTSNNSLSSFFITTLLIFLLLPTYFIKDSGVLLFWYFFFQILVFILLQHTLQKYLSK
ncbi:glycosyltransferase family 4 [alpha proteobacterium HIMB59]|nr:glycosyltransferase family 4 [alpha proteobacterium HIMB59]